MTSWSNSVAIYIIRRKQAILAAQNINTRNAEYQYSRRRRMPTSDTPGRMLRLMLWRMA